MIKRETDTRVYVKGIHESSFRQHQVARIIRHELVGEHICIRVEYIDGTQDTKRLSMRGIQWEYCNEHGHVIPVHMDKYDQILGE